MSCIFYGPSPLSHIAWLLYVGCQMVPHALVFGCKFLFFYFLGEMIVLNVDYCIWCFVCFNKTWWVRMFLFGQIGEVCRPIILDWLIAQHAHILEWTGRAFDLEVGFILHWLEIQIASSTFPISFYLGFNHLSSLMFCWY